MFKKIRFCRSALMISMIIICTSLTAQDGPMKSENEEGHRPNIIIIYTDDMGMGDLSCYNSGWIQTPNIDKLARNGIKFSNYYSASPVCSPSRAAITTGIYPSELGITTFLDSRINNAKCEQFDYLNPSNPSMARILKDAGYRTGHFGKWHMGGGRDVHNAPSIANYGFDEYVSTYESPNPDPLITSKNWIWSEIDSVKRWDRTRYFVDKTLDFFRGTMVFHVL